MMCERSEGRRSPIHATRSLKKVISKNVAKGRKAPSLRHQRSQRDDHLLVLILQRVKEWCTYRMVIGHQALIIFKL